MTMAAGVSRVSYFYCSIRDRPGEAYSLLSRLADSGVDLLAFSAIPTGIGQTQLMLFPEDEIALAQLAEDEGLSLDGPHHAILIRGDDRLGELAEIHNKLAERNINVSASSGLTDGRGGYGYIVYTAAQDIDAAAAALGA
jgi:hypothetical protein